MAKGGTKILFGFTFFVLLVGGLAGGGAWYLTENRPEGYEATATLLVTGPNTDFHAPAQEREDGLQKRMHDALGLPPRPRPEAIAASDYATLFSTDHMASVVKEKLGEKLQDIPMEDVRHAMRAEAPVALQTRDNVVYRRVISLRYTANNPELAAEVANTWAEAAQAFAEKLGAKERDAIVSELEEDLVRLRAQLAEVQAAPVPPPQVIPVMPQAPKPDHRKIASDALRAELQDMERALARDEAALSTLKTYVSKAPVAVVLELSVKEADLETTLAGTRAERDYLAQKVAELAPEDGTKKPTPESAPPAESERAVLQGAVPNLVPDISAPQVTSLEHALSRATNAPPVIQIAAPAVTPERPIGPHRYVLVGGAAILGAILGMIVYFALLTLRVYARELDRS